VTEIPEHLLKRSRERRQALGLPTEGGDVPATTAPAEGAAPATAAAAPPAPPRATPPPTPAAPPPPKPDPPYLQAAKRQKKIPLWVMPVLALLPVWMFMYAKALQPPQVEVTGPLAEGATVYGSCASCHGSGGEGGVGPQLSNGEVLKTFPKIEQQLSFVYTGNTPYIGQPYGDPNRPGGAHIGGTHGPAGAMPAWGTNAGGPLTDVDLVSVICHERITLAGEDPLSAEALSWCTADGEKYQQVVSGGLAAAGVSVPAG
jgi:mono/diheme cytochrome c family protein